MMRRPKSYLNLKVVANKAKYSPGDKVKLRIFATDENGTPGTHFNL